MPSVPLKSLNFVDVFSGCGGLSLGLSQAGFKGLFAIEHDKNAFETFEENFLRHDSRFPFEWPPWLQKNPVDISSFLKVHKKKLSALRGSIDLLAGGPPCQGFSSAGRRRADDPRNQLFKAYLQLVNLLRPKMVLIENVRGFTVDFGKKNEQAIENFSVQLSRALAKDYDVYSSLINLTAFGVPQNRTRYFLLAFEKNMKAGDPFKLLHNTLPSFLRKLGIQTPVSSLAAIGDLELSRCGTQANADTAGFKEIKYSGPVSAYQRLLANKPTGTTDLRLARHTPAITKRFRQIIRECHAEGRLNRSISDDLRARYGLKKKALRVLDPDRPSPTVTSMPDDLLHYKEPRILTVRENARLQSFPDWFVFKGKYTTGGHRRRHEVPRYTQVANAVPPLAGRAIGEMLLDMFSTPAKYATDPLQTRASLRGVSKAKP